MVIGNFTELALQNFTVAEAQSILLPVIQFIIGMVIYSIFIFKFYRFIARKDIFRLNLAKYNTSSLGFIKKIMGVIFYVIEYILLFPIFAFFWFLVLVVFMSFLAKTQTISNVLLVAIALVATVRTTAYYHEDLSKDLAKMLPFALLGIFLVDITYFSFDRSFEFIKQLPSFWKTGIYYLLFVIVLEFVLRILSVILAPFVKKKQQINE